MHNQAFVKNFFYNPLFLKLLRSFCMNRSCVRLILISSVVLFSSVVFASSSAPQIKTRSGTVEGKQEGSVQAFLGIPYAMPTVGNLRWKAPVPAEKWSGVKKTT